MRKQIVCLLLACCAVAGAGAAGKGGRVTMQKSVLMDKIKGAWAGKTIGCTYGGPTEFRYRGTMIADSIPITYDDGCIKWHFDNNGGLYDDIYMDLTFVQVIDSLGIDAPQKAYATAFATAPYPLWHANQAARYNILNGIPAPKSGHWKYNMHADCIDFQIEADFAGIMSPGMPNASSRLCDRVGHIMNYGDGWYGGVYVAAMCSYAFISDDLDEVVTKALETIPVKSRFHRVMMDVIKWCHIYPDDWKRTWQLLEDTYGHTDLCPEGVRQPLNIDAYVNSAYVVMGLLYGRGDFGRTMEIAARCGQDSDCNPSTAAGILGIMQGYSSIPERWLKSVREVEDRPFEYTDISLNRVYRMSFDHALQVIRRNGGREDGASVEIRTQEPKAVRLERSFDGLVPSVGKEYYTDMVDMKPIEFDGAAIGVQCDATCADREYRAEVEYTVDGGRPRVKRLAPSHPNTNYDLLWITGLRQGRHTLSMRWLNPRQDARLHVLRAAFYAEE